MKKIIISLCILIQTLVVATAQEIKEGAIRDNCQCRPTLIDSLLLEFNLESAHGGEVKNNLINVRERIDFLNSDFGTTNFNYACKVKCADIVLPSGAHIGVVDIGLSQNDKKKCLQVIKASNRSNFRTKVLTKFRVLEKRNELVIIYSETPYDEKLVKFFNERK